MFAVKECPKSPEVARQLLNLSELGLIDVDDGIHELAKQGLLSCEDFAGFALPFDDRHLKVAQWLHDNRYRGVVVESTDGPAAKSCLMAIWKKSFSKLLILTKPSAYSWWKNQALHVFPEKKISVFGNPRFLKSSKKKNADFVFNDKPDMDADIWITSYSQVILHRMLDDVIPCFCIFDEQVTKKNTGYRWSDAFVGLLNEIPRVIITVNLNQFKDLQHTEIVNNDLRNLCPAHRVALLELVDDFLFPGSGFSVWGGANKKPASADLYSLVKTPHFWGTKTEFLKACGINTDLLEASKSTNKITLVKNNIFLNGKTYQKYGQHITSEEMFSKKSGSTIADIVADIMRSKDPYHHGFYKRLLTNHWCMAKAETIQQIVDELIDVNLHKTLILVQSKELVTSIRLMLDCQDLMNEPKRRLATRSYVFPNLGWEKYSVLTDDHEVSSDPIIISNIESLNHDILTATHNIILAEWPMDPNAMVDILQLSEAYGCRLFKVLLAGTWEDYVSRAVDVEIVMDN